MWGLKCRVQCRKVNSFLLQNLYKNTGCLTTKWAFYFDHGDDTIGN